MGAPYPVLYNGLGTSQGIYDLVTSPVLRVGTRAALSDGRVYYYARSSQAAVIPAGSLVQSELVHGDMDDLATDTHVVGDTAINVTAAGSKTFAVNELAGGYCTINSGTTGAGISYKIDSNLLTGATAQFACQLVDAVAVAFNANTTATVTKNPWMDAVIAPGGAAGLMVGIPNVAVPAGDSDAQYYWCQTWGVAAAAMKETADAAGDALMAAATTPGSVEVATAQFQKIGTNIFAAVEADYCPIFLSIAP